MERQLSRRLFLKRTGAAGVKFVSVAGLALAPTWLRATEDAGNASVLVRRVTDPVIRAGLEAAVLQNLIPAATERVYRGHFTINADGGGYGSDSTWPGLDSWQMIGPYL